MDKWEKRQIHAKDEREPKHKLKNNIILSIFKETQHSLIFCFVEDERMLCQEKRLCSPKNYALNLLSLRSVLYEAKWEGNELGEIG